MNMSPSTFTTIVLAADRESANPVAQAAGVRCKSLAPVAGVPMVFRVLNALGASSQVGERILCGPPKSIMMLEPELTTHVDANHIRWVENQATPSTSAYHVMQLLPEDLPILLTAGDQALLHPEIVDHFCLKALNSSCDVVAAVARHDTVIEAYPDTRRTAYRFKDGDFCSCNLFAFLTPRARAAALFWRQLESQRKSPLRIITTFGWIAVMRYLLGRLTLSAAFDLVSRRLGFKAGVVIMPFPEAAIDVDSVGDWQIVNRITNKSGH
jgi:CTP:molybdopterin cytidylyltransferase MocA